MVLRKLIATLSTGAGFVLSILGTIFLFIGQLVSFARKCFGLLILEPPHKGFGRLLVLYGLGTIVALIGTGFVIGVCELLFLATAIN
jgi:hypothetical protein